jgi:hypothetical protein
VLPEDGGRMIFEAVVGFYIARPYIPKEIFFTVNSLRTSNPT